jgi:hypothetical protein
LTTSPPVSGGLFLGQCLQLENLVLFNERVAQGSENFAWCDGNEIYKYDF